MNKTTCISIRLRENDIDRIKAIARRLEASDSDVIRFGIRLALSRLIPLLDGQVCCARLLPVFIEHDAEVVRHFELDTHHLERVINASCAEPTSRVDVEDIKLVTLHGLSTDYLRIRLREILGDTADIASLADALRSYLYEKYAVMSD